MTDSLEKYLQDLRFDVPTGLVERAKMNASAAETTHAFQSQTARRSRAVRWPRLSSLPAVIAALLAIVIVATRPLCVGLAPPRRLRFSRKAKSPPPEAPAELEAVGAA